MKCPKCLGQLEKKSVTAFRTSNIKELHGAGLQFTLDIDQCFVCGGVWFDNSELDKYLTERIRTIDSPSIGNDLDRRFDEKSGNCPRCDRPLQKENLPQDMQMMVDRCEQCSGIWLDSTEIDRLERLSARGDRPLSFIGRVVNAIAHPSR